jgi:hypothetical protein
MQAGGLVIGANAFFFSRRDRLVELARQPSKKRNESTTKG